MQDLISRQAAIDALARMMPRSYTPDGSHPADEEIFRAQEVFVDCIEALEILPSAQPEIIRCGECRYYRECEIFGKKITLCKRREYDSMYTEPDDFCSRGARREE